MPNPIYFVLAKNTISRTPQMVHFWVSFVS